MKIIDYEYDFSQKPDKYILVGFSCRTDNFITSVVIRTEVEYDIDDLQQIPRRFIEELKSSFNEETLDLLKKHNGKVFVDLIDNILTIGFDFPTDDDAMLFKLSWVQE